MIKVACRLSKLDRSFLQRQKSKREKLILRCKIASFRWIRHCGRGCVFRCGDAHYIRQCHHLRDDWTDHAYRTNNDSCINQQRHRRSFATEHIRQHHSHQEAALLARSAAIQFRYVQMYLWILLHILPSFHLINLIFS